MLETIYEIVQYPILKCVQPDDPIVEETSSLLHLTQKQEVVSGAAYNMVRTRMIANGSTSKKQRNIKV